VKQKSNIFSTKLKSKYSPAPATVKISSLLILLQAVGIRCQATLLTSAKFLTYYCLSVILLVSAKE